ncbi:MAG: fibronectin type III domain-containing protein, partial [Chryseobacterium sp.]|nr:fibronectin type III domain-containing protein [Chryseobacterium sp.]
MKKILFSCLLFLIATVTNAQIYLGSGTTQTGIAPIDVNYGYSYTQQIFTKTEIGATSAGNITAVKFFLPAAADISNSVAWKVYVGHTTLSIFSGTTAWIPVASLTEVFTGNVANVGGEVTITFNAPFAYNNTDNLVVAVLEDTPDYTASSNRFYTYSGVTNSTLYYRSDTTVPNPASPPTGTRSPTKSRIGIMGLIPLPPACPSLTAPSAGSTTVSATPSFTWSAASGAAGYKISLGTAPGGTDIMNAVDVGNVTTYQYITGLMYGTQYYLTVSAYNVSGDSTGCTERTFTVTTTVPCPTVTAPFTSQTGVSVTPTFTWSAVPYATDYIISIGTTSGGTDILNAQSVGNVTSYTYSGTPALAPNTQYYYNIRAASGTYLSGTCSNRNFTTQCPTVSAPFMQDFSSGVLPACWSNQNPDSTSTTAMWKFTGNAGTGASQANNGRAGGTYAWVDASSPYDDMHNVELLTPLIDLTGLTAPLVSFEWFKNHSTSTTVPSPSTYDDNKLTVDINDGNGWVTFFTSSSNDPLWRTVNIPLPASYIGATIQVRFTVDKNTGTNPYFYDDLLLDNVEVKEVPACMMPAGPYSVSGVTMSSAVVNWTAPVILPTGYTVYYSATNTAPDATTVLDATNSVSVLVPAVSTVISGLTHATPYYVWVRSNCGTTSSDWLSVGTFTTLCNAFTVPYFENFDTTTVGTSTNNNAPNCWKYLEPSGWAGYGYVSTNNFSPPNGYYIYDSGTSGGGMLVSPTTTALMNGNNRVRFMANAGGNNYNLQVGTLSDPSDPATFTAIGALIPLTTTFAQYTVDIPAGTDQYLVFRHPGQT